MATKTRSKFTFQPSDTITTIAVVNSALKPEQKHSSVSTQHTEFVNPEGTIAVVSRYRGYEFAVKVPSLSIEDLVEADSDYLTEEHSYYVNTRANGVWLLVPDLTASNKTDARNAAERIARNVQDVNDPSRVALDGSLAPALTIALQEVESERDYYRDRRRVSAVQKIAEQAGVLPSLLALAIKEDRLIWSTPPVAPRQVMVVVLEDATANLTERLVDEVVLASGTVEGLGRIVEEGSVSSYLLRMRTVHQKQAVRAVLTQREKAVEALQAVVNRAQGLLDSLEKGEVIGRGFHDTLRLADDAEKAQAAASAYGHEVADAGYLLPAEFLAALLKNAYRDTDTRYRWANEDIRNSLQALAVINGMPLDKHDR